MPSVSVVSITGHHDPHPNWRASIAAQTVEPIEHVEATRGLPVVIDPRADTVAVLDDGVELVPDAIAALQRRLDAAPEADLVYGDHVGVRGHAVVWRSFAPEHSPERLLQQPVVGRVVLVRRQVLDRVGGTPTDGGMAAVHDLALRVAATTDRIARIPDVVARVRVDDIDPDTDGDRLAVVERRARRIGLDASLSVGDVPGVVRVDRRAGDSPLVSIVVPTRGTDGLAFGRRRSFVVEALRSIVEQSTYRRFELVVVHDPETPPDVLDELRSLPAELSLVAFDRPFNFPEKIAAGADAAGGELLLLLNDDTELIEPSSIERMVAHLDDPGVAMVGAKLLFEDGRLQHGGHVYTGAIHHACFGWPGESPGPAPLFPLAVARECSGVTAGCALVRRSVFDAVGGLDPALPHNYNDVDLSLKIRSAGHRIIWTPHATFFHFESRSRRPEIRPDELAEIERRWGDELRADPYYHPGLAQDSGDWRAPPAPTAPTEPAAPSASSGQGTRPGLVGRIRRRVSAIARGGPSRPHGVNLIGYFGATSGLGDRARELAVVLDVAGIHHSDWDLDVTESAAWSVERAPGPHDGVIFDTTVAVVTALAFPGLHAAYGPLVREVDRVIGYWFWELSEIPDSHRPGLEMVDEIWAPTSFVRDAYRSATELPVRLVPLPIRRPVPSPRERASFGWGEEFVFLTSFDHLSSMERKHPRRAIEAFVSAFPDRDVAVRLVVKSINGGARPAAHRELVEQAGGDDRIDIVDRTLTPGAQAALLGAADAFVSLHRSEGLGLHIAEAMWLGTPVIATDYSGSADLTRPAATGPVAELVPSVLVPVERGGEAYRSGHWAEPDLASAATAMRRLATDVAHREALAGRALDRMLEQADPSSSCRLVRAALDDRASRHRRARRQ
jgi:glycosyltransferase involved in cell wall biosynthesis